MKILFISTFYGKKIGGAEISTKFLFEGLVTKDNEINLVTSQKVSGGNIYSLNLCWIPKKIFIVGNYFLDNYLIWKYKKIIKKIKPEIIHVQDLFALPSAVVAAKHLNIPVVVTVRDNLPRNYSPLNFIFKYRNLSYLKSLKNSNFIISISKSIKDNLVLFGIPPKKIKTIYNICPPLIYNNIKKEGNDFVVLGLGRMCREKGFDILIQSIAYIIKHNNINNIKLKLIGEGPQKKYLKKMANYLNLGNRVEFIPWMNNKDILNEYLKSDVIIVPSVYEEPLGRVALEAAMCSKPVIASNVGGLKEIIQNNLSGFLVKPNSYLSLSSKIINLYNDPTLCKYLGKNAQRIVLEKFSKSVIVSETINFYDEIISK